MLLPHVSLFSGIGGIDLAAEHAGFTTTAVCERDPFCQKVLAKHWPDAPLFKDVRHVSAASLADHGIDPTTIKLVSGGFPCQPYSHAGQQRGAADDRALWPEMLRVVSDIKPAWVLGENVAGLINMALDTCVADLEGIGYEVGVFVLPACGVGAFHQRERVFIAAHAEHKRCQCGSGSCGRGHIFDRANGQLSQDQPQGNERQRGVGAGGHDVSDTAGAGFSERGFNKQPTYATQAPTRLELEPERCRKDVEYAGSAGCQERITPAFAAKAGYATGRFVARGANRATQSGMGSSLDGLPAGLVGFMNAWPATWEDGLPRVTTEKQKDRVNKIKALGNAVVPQQVFPILYAMAEYERREVAA